MTLNKFTYINYIYNGKQSKLKIIYSHNIFNKVPLYYSDDIESILLIKSFDNEIFILANSNYVNKIGTKALESDIIRLLAKEIYHNASNDMLDIVCLKAIGTGDINNIIKSDIDNTERINRLNEMIYIVDKLGLPSIEDILNKVKFVSIGDAV